MYIQLLCEHVDFVNFSLLGWEKRWHRYPDCQIWLENMAKSICFGIVPLQLEWNDCLIDQKSGKFLVKKVG